MSVAASNQISWPIHRPSPSPENDAIYGAISTDDNDLIDLCNDIVANGILEPIVVTADGYIVSGHRRFAAAKMAGLKNVPVIRLDVRRDECSELEYKRLLRRYNHQRHKNASQRLKRSYSTSHPDIAHEQLITARAERDLVAMPQVTMGESKSRSAISTAKRQMLDAANAVIESLTDFWPLSLRQIHYAF